jgi:hypothetical protein
MRLLRTLALVAAVGAFAVPAFAEPPAHAGKNKAEWQAKREAKLLEKLKQNGISEAKAKNVVSVVKSFHGEMRAVKQEMKSAKQALRQNDADKAARDRLAAAKQKKEGIKQRRTAALAKILTPAEQVKVKELLDRKGHGKHGRAGKTGTRA